MRRENFYSANVRGNVDELLIIVQKQHKPSQFITLGNIARIHQYVYNESLFFISINLRIEFNLKSCFLDNKKQKVNE